MLLIQKQHFPLIPTCFTASLEAVILYSKSLIPAFGKAGKHASSASGEAEQHRKCKTCFWKSRSTTGQKKEAEFVRFSLFFTLT